MRRPIVDFDVGPNGLDRLVDDGCDAVVIVDILTFSTAVDVGIARGALILPCQKFAGPTVQDERPGSVLAVPRALTSPAAPYSLSPGDLLEITPGTELILPSRNGATLTAAAARGDGDVFVACFRNGPAVAAAMRHYSRVGVLAAGEQWPDGSLRVAVEDVAGAGAVISHLKAQHRPTVEAEWAGQTYRHINDLRECRSAVLLTTRGYGADVEIALEDGVSQVVPQLDPEKKEVIRDGRLTVGV